MESEQNLIIYNTEDGKASVALYAKDGDVWMNQQQLAELFDTSVPNVSTHISNILKERELKEGSVIKNYLTTASDGKKYDVEGITVVEFNETYAQHGIFKKRHVVNHNLISIGYKTDRSMFGAV